MSVLDELAIGIQPATVPPDLSGADCICEELTMALDVPDGIQQSALARLSGAGTLAHENMVQFAHILDLKYETDRHMVSLVESLGVREVTSRSGQAGIPIAGAEAGATK
jgi:hypothetical protein